VQNEVQNISHKSGSKPGAAEKTGSSGVVYLALGDRYIDECVYSFCTLRAFNPGLSVVVFTDDDAMVRSEDPEIRHCSRNKSPFKLKTEILGRSPFQNTLFLDTDTIVLGDLSDAYPEAGKHFAIARAPYIDFTQQPFVFHGYHHPFGLNTGVFSFKASEAVNEFLAHWQHEVGLAADEDIWAGHNGDQAAFNRVFRRLFGRSPLRFQILENRVFNFRLCNPLDKITPHAANIKILHGRSYFNVAKIAAETGRLEILVEAANQALKMRPGSELLQRIRNNLVRHGGPVRRAGPEA
jgi:hypothetical protein